MNKSQYSDEEAREILKRAVDFQERESFQYSGEELLDLGREMGLSRAAIVKAEQSMLVGRETPVSEQTRRFTGTSESDPDLAQAEAMFQRQRMQEFYLHLIIFACIMPLMLVLNSITGGIPWFLIVFLGWGAGLAGHFFERRRQEGDDYEKEFNKWLEKREAQLHKRQQWVKRLKDE